MKASIDIYQGVIVPLRINSENFVKEHLESLTTLQELPKIDLQIADVTKSEMVVSVCKKIPKSIKTFYKKTKRHILNEVIFRFRINIDFEKKYFEDIEKKYGEKSNDFFIQYLLSDDIEKRFYEFLMILNLCRVGGFLYGHGVLNNGFNLKKLQHLKFYTQELLEYSIEKKWPKFERIDILKTWKWFRKSVTQNNIDELSCSSLGRAFNAFTYLYEDSDDINKLFWTMVGIEALYVKGKEGIAEQIKVNGQLYLGEIEEFKKRLSKMYEFRSSFIHGSKNFPSYFHIHDGMESYEKFTNEIFEILLTAESMLIATLQRMANENRTSLDFKYILE